MSQLNQKSSNPLEQFKSLYWDRYADSVRECEQRLADVAGQPAGMLGESCSLTLSAGGKRLRPLLMFLSTRSGVDIREEQLAAAAAVELVHMATLVHDDVLDHAELRRGKPTLAAKYGTPVSVAAGDYLFSTAFKLLASAGSAAAVPLLSRTSLELSLGELAQMEQAADYGTKPESYFARCRLKTSGLFIAACQIGALLSGCADGTIEAMGEYGRCLGLSFQLSDDILDFEGDPAETGKEIGTDLRDGTVTLPLILAMRRDQSIRSLLEGELSKNKVKEICRRVEAAGGLEDAREQALLYVERAGRSLMQAEAELDTAPLSLIAGATIHRRV